TRASTARALDRDASPRDGRAASHVLSGKGVRSARAAKRYVVRHLERNRGLVRGGGPERPRRARGRAKGKGSELNEGRQQRSGENMQRIPIIDLSAARMGGLASRQAVARDIDATCREIGFFTVTGHGVPVATMDKLRSKAHAFFALPLQEKCKAIHPVSGTPRGYRAQGLESLAQANAGTTPPDLKEFYHFGRESWPEETYYSGPEGRRYFIPNFWPAT